MMRIGPRAIALKTTIIGARSPHSYPNKHIKRIQPKYERVLDIGCGNGRHFIFPMTIGIDADPKILEEAKKKGMCIYGDAQHLPVRAEIFDLALFCYSLEYMKNPDKAREEGRRVAEDSFELIYPAYYSWDRVFSN